MRTTNTAGTVSKIRKRAAIKKAKATAISPVKTAMTTISPVKVTVTTGIQAKMTTLAIKMLNPKIIAEMVYKRMIRTRRRLKA